MRKKIIVSGVTILFVALFFYTGMSKLLNNKAFISQVGQINFLKPVASLLAWMVPITELVIVMLLIRSRWRLMGLYSCLALMVLFTGYMILLSRDSDYIACGCGGFLEQIPPPAHIILNLALTGLAITAIYLKNKLKMINQGKTATE